MNPGMAIYCSRN